MPVPSKSQARDLVEHFGSQTEAARAIGVHRLTLRYWLYPEQQKRKVAARYYADPEAKRAQVREYYYADPEAKRAQVREYYYAETAIQRGRRQLRNRRIKALQRRAQREQRGA